MTEPRRTDSLRTSLPAGDRERVSRIEELLVSGLDHYFAADYEQAINIWTRVVFLERDHDRARAYIERARSAIAEQQRESEELLHRGVDAYKEGDVGTARDLLTRAVDRGAPSDEALVLLDRIDRLDGVGVEVTPSLGPPSEGPTPRATASATGWRALRWMVAGTVVVAAATTIMIGSSTIRSWLIDGPSGTPPAVPVPPEALPIVRAADTLLDRARALHAGGHPYDALRLLDSIGPGDPVRADADRLRADVQQALLATAMGTTPQSGGPR